jgi:conjugal transfer pilus assembly protein TraB
MENKKRQHLTLFWVASVAILLVGGTAYFIEKDSAPSQDTTAKTETIRFSSPITDVNGEKLWVEHSQNKIKKQDEQIEALKNEVVQVKTNVEHANREDDLKYQALVKENQLLQETIKNNDPANRAIGAENSLVKSSMQRSIAENTAQQESKEGRIQDGIGIDNDELHLQSPENKRPQKNPDTYVPAGAYAEAIMLGAADASASVQAQYTPSPMFFRIIANGTLPNHQKSHLKNCVVTAAVVGDISSERGQIRLERMSCFYPNGEIIDQKVEGTVFGMDAKNGIRGNPVWREGALLGRAWVSGMASGVGKGVSQSFVTNQISPLGTTQTVNGGASFKNGLAEASEDSMKMIANYNIKRAEQYHPVIQLSAGQPVDIVFLCGFYLDGRPHESCDKNANENKQEPSQLFPSTTQTATGLTLSEDQLAKIKQNEQAMGLTQQSSGGMG